jgi:hypothetical protein
MSRKTLYTLLGSLLWAGYAWLAWNAAGGAGHGAVPAGCMFKAVTHVPCPSCGTTRAILLLLHGDLSDSLLLNPFGAVLFLALVAAPVWLLADMLRNGDSLHRFYMAAERVLMRKAWISVPLVSLVIANWLWNISKGH